MTDQTNSYQGAETTGFQSPAQDYIEQIIDLSRVLDLGKPGYRYWKAGVMLNELIDANTAPAQMFPTRDPVGSAKLMAAMDSVNLRFGRGMVRPAVSGVERRWTAKADFCRRAIRRGWMKS